METPRTILDLCAGSGSWSEPYREAGYRVLRFDLTTGQDVRLLQHLRAPVHGILAAPPCCHFANSGARWWAAKGEAALRDGLSIVDACLRAVAIYQPAWWALENPVGRLSHYLGLPSFQFDPCDFGDPWTKRTLLWGEFNHPTRRPTEPTEGSKIHLMSSSQKAERAVTPAGFAKAFFEANP